MAVSAHAIRVCARVSYELKRAYRVHRCVATAAARHTRGGDAGGVAHKIEGVRVERIAAEEAVVEPVGTVGTIGKGVRPEHETAHVTFKAKAGHDAEYGYRAYNTVAGHAWCTEGNGALFEAHDRLMAPSSLHGGWPGGIEAKRSMADLRSRNCA